MARILKGDKVLITVGKDKNKVGTVERVMPESNKVVVTGINTVKKHLKKSVQNPQGGIIEKIAPIHISNVILLDPTKNKPTRVGYKMSGKSKVRFAKLTNSEIKIEKGKK